MLLNSVTLELYWKFDFYSLKSGVNSLQAKNWARPFEPEPRLVPHLKKCEDCVIKSITINLDPRNVGLLMQGVRLRTHFDIISILWNIKVGLVRKIGPGFSTPRLCHWARDLALSSSIVNKPFSSSWSSSTRTPSRAWSTWPSWGSTATCWSNFPSGSWRPIPASATSPWPRTGNAYFVQ